MGTKPQFCAQAAVVDVPDPVHLAVEILHVDGPDGDAVPLQRAVRHALDLLQLDLLRVADIREQIFGFPQSRLFQQAPGSSAGCRSS